MNIYKSKTANALTSAAYDHVIAVSDDIYDEELEMYQSSINQKANMVSEIINARNLPIPTPIINPNWVVFKHDGHTVVNVDSVNEGPSTINPIIEIGYKALYDSATYRWISTDGCQDPTSIDTDSSTWKSGILPESNHGSEGVSSAPFDTDTTLSIKLRAKEVGLKVSGNYILPATGYVSSSASARISFRKRLYHGNTESSAITEDVIKSLSSKELVSTKSLTVSNLTTSGKTYYVYAFPERLSQITANGVTAWDINVSG
ncbi:MAG: hypothetical protein IKB96_02035, partial [Prevotella sp.]|nr:hypothetical protein [Prevotella sp.]